MYAPCLPLRPDAVTRTVALWCCGVLCGPVVGLPSFRRPLQTDACEEEGTEDVPRQHEEQCLHHREEVGRGTHAHTQGMLLNISVYIQSMFSLCSVYKFRNGDPSEGGVAIGRHTGIRAGLE